MRKWLNLFLPAVISAACLFGCATADPSYPDSADTVNARAKATVAGGLQSSGGAAAVKVWSNGQFLPGGVMRWTADGDQLGMEVWCNSTGYWGISSLIGNNSISNRTYRITIYFGHVDNADPGTFFEYSHHDTDTVSMAGQHQQRTAAAAATGPDQSLVGNFPAINAIKVVMQEGDDRSPPSIAYPAILAQAAPSGP